MGILRRGLTGAPVKRLQRHLNIAADGDFGPATEQAVRDFQAAAGLKVDGIAGPDTFTALGLHELVLLRVGSRGTTVKKLQEGLGIAADGIFGGGTEQAVRDFQASQGLVVDGMAGPVTLARLSTFAEITEAVVAKAAVQPDEVHFEGEPLPELDGAAPVSGTAVEMPEDTSVWSRVKGWFG
ncbi:MAG: peptidoglycan-binding protein [Pseudomonadota bacterium]